MKKSIVQGFAVEIWHSKKTCMRRRSKLSGRCIAIYPEIYSRSESFRDINLSDRTSQSSLQLGANVGYEEEV